MKGKGVWLTLATLACTAALPSPARADEYHDRSFRFGQRSMAMGGAVVGHVHEPTASYDNPAGLAWLEGSLFSGAVQFYGLDERTLKGGLRAGDFAPRDLKSSSFLALPSSSVLTHALKKGTHRLAYSTFLHADTDERFGGSFDRSWALDSATTSDARLRGSRRIRDRMLFIGPSYAYRASDTFSLGVSAFYVRRDQSLDTWLDYEEEHTAAADGAFVRTIFSDETVSTAVTDTALFAMLGVMWRPTPSWSLGATVATPAMSLSGEATQDFKFTWSGDPLSTNPDETQPQRGSEHYGNIGARSGLPWRFAAGAAWQPDPTVTVSAAGWLATPLSYRRLDLGEAEAVETGVVRQIERRMVWNAAVGAEWVLSKKWPIRLGMFTNRSAAPDVPDVAEVPAPAQIDLYGATFSGGYKDGEKAVNVGAELQWGAGFDSVASDIRSPTPHFIRVPRDQFRVVIFVSGAMALAKTTGQKLLLEQVRKVTGDRPRAPSDAADRSGQAGAVRASGSAGGDAGDRPRDGAQGGATMASDGGVEVLRRHGGPVQLPAPQAGQPAETEAICDQAAYSALVARLPALRPQLKQPAPPNEDPLLAGPAIDFGAQLLLVVYRPELPGSSAIRSVRRDAAGGWVLTVARPGPKEVVAMASRSDLGSYLAVLVPRSAADQGCPTVSVSYIDR